MRFFKRKTSRATEPGISRLALDGLDIELTRKDIKRLYLRVSADGRVRVSAPKSVPMDTVRGFVVSKRDWIREQQDRFHVHARLPQPEYVDGETHFFGGRRYPLRVREHDGPPRVTLSPDAIDLAVRPGTAKDKRRALIEDWQRRHLKAEIPRIVARYEGPMGVQVREFGVKRMRTRWGTCNIRARRIWLSLELAKRPFECLEYVVVHEMAHLIEAGHNARFYAVMDEFLPGWRTHREALKRLPSDCDPVS
ncbi:MAG: DUF45 domain-containing protein [Gammaproteobacteria bacterium]|nr:DUF45 domain-containing protein [Gammaproteobacteria bacterium]